MADSQIQNDASTSNIKQFTDENGNVYTTNLKNPIGRGGQGEVLSVAEDRYLAIKRSFTSSLEEKKAAIKRIKLLRYLPIPHTARISMPIAFLKDEPGFVMRLLEKMRPLIDLMPNCIVTENLRTGNLLPNNQIPEWLNPLDESDANPNAAQAKEKNDNLRRYAYFAHTGGLRARLSWLLQLTELIDTLHSNDLIFADLSPNNIYITSGTHQQVWLIDVDNITYQSLFDSFVMTPNYGAPEIFNATPGYHNSIVSDLFSFALIAFETLCICKPFDVPNKSAAASAVAADNDVNSPWLFDSTDPSKHPKGVPPIVKYNLSLPLLKLLSQTFEAGRTDPASRLPIWMWHASIQNALDLTVKCPNCGMGFIYGEKAFSKCDFCHHKLEFISAYRAYQEPVFAHEYTSEQFDIPKHLFTPCSRKNDKSSLVVYIKANHIYFRLANNEPIKFYKIAKGREISSLDNSQLDQSMLIRLDKHNPYFEVNLAEYEDHDLGLILDTKISWPIRLALRNN